MEGEDVLSTVWQLVLEQMAYNKATKAAVDNLEEIIASAVEAKTLIDNAYSEQPQAELLRASKCIDSLLAYYRAFRTTMLPGGAVYELLKQSCQGNTQTDCPVGQCRSASAPGGEVKTSE